MQVVRAYPVAIALLAGVLGGCASSPTPVRVEPPRSQVGSWQAVLPGPAVAEALAAGGRADWIDSRLDASLAPRPEEPLLATTQWPLRDRPTLSRPRVIWVPRSPEGYVYYRTIRERTEYRRGW